MTCELVTGSAGTDHVSSADDGSMFASVFGPGRYAVHQGNNLEATLVNSNTVQVDTGAGFIDGRYFRVTAAETLTIDSGSQGNNRIDLVGVKYLYDSGTGVETCSLAVVKGTPTSGTPSIPTYTDGDITAGATEAFFPLYSIEIDGITPSTPVKLFHFMSGTVSCPWPVGSVLQMTSSTNPNDVYPGTTWSRIEGMFLLGSSSGHSLGSIGGSESVTLVNQNFPKHLHTYEKANSTTGGTALTAAQLPSLSGSVKFRRMEVSNGNLFAEASGIMSTGSGTFSSSYDKVNQYDGSTTSAETLTISFGSGNSHTHSVSTTTSVTDWTGQTNPTPVSIMPPYKVVNIWERVA